MKRPSPITVDPISVSVVRGPRPDGRWYWRGRLSEAGTQRTVWTGWATREEARKAAAELVARGEYSTPTTVERAGTVRDLMELWIGHHEALSDANPLTQRNRRTAAKAIVAQLGGVALDRLTSSALDLARDRMLRAGAAPRTVRHTLQALRQAWTWAYRERLHDERELPRCQVKVDPDTYVYNHVTPSRGDAAAVLARLNGWSRLVTLLLAATGARIREIATLTWEHVDLEAATISLRGKGRRRPAPIPPPIVDLLRPLMGAADQRVVSVAVATVTTQFGRNLRAACLQAGVERFSPHGLRRYVSTSLLLSGVAPEVEGRMLGHSPEIARRHYLSLTDDPRRVAMRAARLGYLEEEGTVIPLRREG